MKDVKNIWDRIVGAVVFVVVVFGLIWLREITLLPFDIFCVLCGVIGSFELLKILQNKSISNKAFLIAFAILVIPVHMWKAEIGVISLMFVLFGARSIHAIFEHEDILKNLSEFTFALIYPAWIFTLLISMSHWENVGTVAVLLVFMTGPFCDVGAYLFGMTIGGKKLCPQLSPNKTIAGAVGGILGGIVGGLTVFFISTKFLNAGIADNIATMVAFIVMGIIGGCFTEVGDLVESAMKRRGGVKDSGNILIGHGGLLDRFDGVILVIIFVYVFGNIIIL